MVRVVEANGLLEEVGGAPVEEAISPELAVVGMELEEEES